MRSFIGVLSINWLISASVVWDRFAGVHSSPVEQIELSTMAVLLCKSDSRNVLQWFTDDYDRRVRWRLGPLRRTHHKPDTSFKLKFSDSPLIFLSHYCGKKKTFRYTSLFYIFQWYLINYSSCGLCYGHTRCGYLITKPTLQNILFWIHIYILTYYQLHYRLFLYPHNTPYESSIVRNTAGSILLSDPSGRVPLTFSL